jgi:hypothetical protein
LSHASSPLPTFFNEKFQVYQELHFSGTASWIKRSFMPNICKGVSFVGRMPKENPHLKLRNLFILTICNFILYLLSTLAGLFANHHFKIKLSSEQPFASEPLLQGLCGGPRFCRGMGQNLQIFLII